METQCGLSCVSHAMFASDCPFDPEDSPMFIRENMRAVNALPLSAAEKKKIPCDNAVAMFRL
jgi:aminocarboxymuconate-semialdehyde decarboxylase